MILIFGTRHYFRTNRSQQRGFCGQCNRFASFKSYNARNFFHLYYIPIIPLGRRKRYHKACNHCQAYRELDLSEYRDLVNELKLNSAEAILAVQEGEPTFSVPHTPDNPIEPVGYLLEAVDWLYASENKDFCLRLAEQLSGKNCQYAQSMIRAAICIQDGNIEEAIQHYSAASVADETRFEPLHFRAHLQAERKRFDEAINSHKLALAKTDLGPVQFSINFQLAELQMKQKAYKDAALTYERLLALHPPLAGDKAFMKNVKKARQKAGLV